MSTERHTTRLNSDLRQFIVAARVVAELLGTSADGWGQACCSTGLDCFRVRYEYKDEHVRIDAARETLAIHIEMLSPHNNPVIAIYDGGRVVRAHGEWRMIREHVMGLARKVLEG
jgi:hypothetical protein